MSIKLSRGSRISVSNLKSYSGENITLTNNRLPSDLPIGIYYGTDVVHRGRRYPKATYYVTFSANDGGGLQNSNYLYKDTAASIGIVRNRRYIIRNAGWRIGLRNSRTINMVYRIIETIPREVRRDPVLTSRYVCALIPTGNYRRGMLQGDWSDNTSRIRFPSTFLRVIYNYYRGVRTKAQCFIYSATLQSMMRHIGIQCRQVASTNAGHNADRSPFIDFLNERYGDRYRDARDSMWNFHCWNEVFLRNKVGVGEWHALDATPQERSVDNPLKGKYVCGPCSIPAIKEMSSTNRHVYDLPYVSAGTHGFSSYAVEWNRGGRLAPVNVFYAMVRNRSGSYITVEQPNGTFVDEAARYRAPRPLDNIIRYRSITSRAGNRVTTRLSGSVPRGANVYMVAITSTALRGRAPNPARREYYTVRTPSRRVGNTFTHTIPNGTTHAFLVSGTLSRARYRGNHIIENRVIRPLVLPTREFPRRRYRRYR